MRLAVYGPCLLPGNVLLGTATASIGGADVSDAWSMSYNHDAYPPDEAPWIIVPYPGTPYAGQVTAATPLQIDYRVTGLNGSMITAVDMVLTNAAYLGFQSIVEFALAYSHGGSDVIRLGWDGDTFLGLRTLHPTGNAQWIDVRTRIFGTSGVLGGGGGPGLFPAVTTPAPVPEPATFALSAAGLILLVGAARRGRRRSGRASAG